MKPDFEAMSRSDLKAYVLAHRDDAEAVSAYVKKISNESGWITHPPLTSPEDLDKYPDFLEKVRRDQSQ